MKTVFLMIARVLYDKGYQEYVDASHIIRKEHPECEFHLLGSIDKEYPNYVPVEVIQRDHDEGTICYLGFQLNVRSYIKEADCIVHPTFYNEGMSRVLMEAMALRKPIITTDIPGCRETVDEGRNGFIVPPKDTNALVTAIRRFLSLTPEDKQRMGEYGRRKAEQEFDVRWVIEVYRRITHKYVQKNGKHSN